MARSSQWKVAFVESEGSMSGVQFSTLYLTQHLNRARWASIVFCPEEGDLPRACRDAGVPVNIFPRHAFCSASIRFGMDQHIPNPLAWGWNILGVLVTARRLMHFLVAEEPDLVVTKGMFSHFYGGLAARWLGIPCIWHVQDFVSERFLGVYRRAFRQLAPWVPDHIIVDGEPIARQLPNTLQERINIVYNGVDTNVFRPVLDGTLVRHELGIPSTALVIGHVARMTPWKGQHYLLEAFVQIAAEVSNAYLLFVGSPVFGGHSYLQYLQKRASDLGVNERVIFAGYRHDLPEVFRAMDIFTFTSTEKDTSPLALISAMASELAIVAFDIEGVREMINHNEEGVLVPVRNVEALAKGINELLVDLALRKRLAASARHRAETTFNLNRYVSQMEEFFVQILNR